MVSADRMNRHGGSSANPPAASLNGERSDECTFILANRNFRLTAYGAKRTFRRKRSI
jgi:hypothetical protein